MKKSWVKESSGGRLNGQTRAVERSRAKVFEKDKMKRRFSIHPIALLVWIWLFVAMRPLVALSYLAAIVIHEYGHFVVAKKLGCAMKNFSLSPYGVALALDSREMETKDEIKIALAGPLFNLVSAFAVVGVWWFFPASFYFLESFVTISCVLALCNLLPAYPLDGGRIFTCLTSFFLKEKCAKRIAIIFNLFLATMFLILFFVMMFVNFNPTFLLFAVFLYGGLLDLKTNSKYEKISIFLKKKKNFSKPQIFCVYGDVTIGGLVKKLQTSKTCMFCLILENGKIINLSEKTILNLSLNFDFDEKLENVFNSKKLIKNK